MLHKRICVSVITLIALVLPASAGAAGYGGLGAQGKVGVADVVCVKRCVAARKATPGALVKVRGVGLESVSKVVFGGDGGPIPVDPRRSSESAAVALVPNGAKASRPFVIDSSGRKSGRSRHKLFVLPRSALPTRTFPIRGKYELWDGFGGARNHQGVDLGAACGTPLVATQPDTVSWRKFQGSAGHYVGLDLDNSNAEILYMHLREPSPLKLGQHVETGDVVGFNGDSGNARGCHLHFEFWNGKAWLGGEVVDPMPYLRELDPQVAPRRNKR